LRRTADAAGDHQEARRAVAPRGAPESESAERAAAGRGAPERGVNPGGERARAREMMRVAAEVHHTLSPVLIPEHWGSRGKEATRRRRRRSPIIPVLTVAALAVLPFIAYVAAVSNVPHIGYHLYQLTHEIAVIDSEQERHP